MNDYHSWNPDASSTADSPVETSYRFIPRGIDPSKSYRILLDSKNISFTVSGYQLMNDGLVLRLENAGMSELVIYESI